MSEQVPWFLRTAIKKPKNHRDNHLGSVVCSW
jgi:hypothetical protein